LAVWDGQTAVQIRDLPNAFVHDFNDEFLEGFDILFFW
jgi:hypothetical protein